MITIKDMIIANMINIVCILIVALGVWLYTYNSTSPSNGIVMLKDYPHAVAICGGPVYVDPGHYNDPQVFEIIQLAKETCPK